MDTYQLGSGKPDGVVGYGGLSMCIEIKDPSKPRSKRKLTPDEEVWHRHWTGGMRIIETPEQCAEVVKVLEGWLEKIRNGPYTSGPAPHAFREAKGPDDYRTKA